MRYLRFAKEVILLAVRWECRYPLSYRDARDLWAKRGVDVDPSTVYRWAPTFGPEIRKRAYSNYRSWCGLQWHVDEAFVRVGGKWRYLWCAVDSGGQLIDFRLTAPRNAKAAIAFIRQASTAVRQ
ncbi:IS6 family transposase [Ruegeria sp. Alg231-54]|uniref:IS6 family transposase n=1 Tax=Ruegeria sp. Alg231-54 TaxID=1922221 RepID=UPI00190279C7|nr:IS6 family transposase [Ruegeria sp. Alg231-54]